MYFTALAGLASLAFSQCASATPTLERRANQYRQNAHTAVKKMQQPMYYRTPSPAAWTIGWWNCAQAVTLLADLREGDNSQFLRQITDGEQGVFNVTWRDQAVDSNRAFTYTSYFDDRLWWTVAMIKVFDVTKNNQYLVSARRTFVRVAADIDKDPCGLFNNAYPGTPRGSSVITQTLYIEAAALLAKRTPAQKANYLKMARAAWKELKADMYIDGLIQGDGLQKRNGQDTCSSNYAFLTYQEGAAMAAMVAMADATGNADWLDIAQSIAEKTASGQYGMIVNGIAKEYCDADFSCNGDSGMFKGIMMRGFYEVYKARPSVGGGGIPQLLKNNADSIWNNARNTKNNMLGLNWSGPFKASSQIDYRLTYHISATMALVYASLV